MTDLELAIDTVERAIDTLEEELDASERMTDKIYGRIDEMVISLGYIAHAVETGEDAT